MSQPKKSNVNDSKGEQPIEEFYEEFLEWTPEEEEEFLRLFAEQEKAGKPSDNV